MSAKLYFEDWVFDELFLKAQDPDGQEIKFTKNERSLLQFFTRHSGKLISRERLLTALYQHDTDIADRNIDYQISRLRSKLKDKSRAPRFIATQYGEGYIWVAKHQNARGQFASPPFIFIGPIYGDCKGHDDLEPFCQQLTCTLNEAFQGARTIENCLAIKSKEPAELLRQRKAEFSLQISISPVQRDQANTITGTIILLANKTARVLLSRQVCFYRDYSSQDLSELSAELVELIREHQLFRQDTPRSVVDEPLSVGVIKAAQLFGPLHADYKATEQSLRAKLDSTDGDFRVAYLLAANLNAQIAAGDFSDLTEREAEIEALTLKYLPDVKNDALYLSAAADRLHRMGDCDLAEQLAERALSIGPSIAACYMVIGRMRVSEGAGLEGISYYDQTLAMLEPEDTFYQLVFGMRCQAYRALGMQDEVDTHLAKLLESEASSERRLALRLFLASSPDGGLAKADIAKLKALPVPVLKHLLRVLYFVWARHFVKAEHRSNMMCGAVRLCLSLHGKSVIPKVILEQMPELGLAVA